ncbi:DMT family transporter [Alphaproteobacteria bacterium]|nr:DMT family transporter [Alphaproteobacteria bacterium]
MNLKVIILYLITTIAWGSAFYFSKIQIGEIPIEWSIIYRFMIASAILFIIAVIKNKKILFNIYNHIYFFVFGLLLFSLHFFAVYKSTSYILSGLTAISFSTIVIFNVFFSIIFFKHKVNLSLIFGSLLGVTGVIFIFLNEFNNISITKFTIIGVFLGIIAAIIASLGNVLSEYFHKSNGNIIIQSTAWGMIYGIIIMLFITLFSNTGPPSIIFEFNYLGPLFYLGIFCTAIAFWSYISLLKSIGASRAGYAWIIAPLIALLISSIYESFNWNIYAILGIIFILMGNIFILLNKNKINKNKEVIIKSIY